MPLTPARMQCDKPALRNYAATHFDEELRDVSGRRFSNELFSGCKFGRVRGAEFVNCVMHDCRLVTEDIRDFVGITVTMNCHAFSGTELSAEVLNAILFLMTTTKGNDVLRQKIEAAIDPERLEKFRRLFPRTE